ncbi:hypothetical protein CONPUDRAFT_159493 [Coniophora puteana RWD-64-598 SS2]|uniref:Uncharacterized protein n=1 Tax=Coniophora puteana (strain RWD-64-598) TaxID=741705 RepID=A0A5M3M995_CONPW|nr:uncharacterized protein CONPUDRAFT_159493 [Coniophora puteana RWD-64-598 SS2]EIW75370.1 hypothetical protein CONPUDRAFT_159493 [Coniophora puteana RWD-64-598 SS2]
MEYLHEKDLRLGQALEAQAPTPTLAAAAFESGESTSVVGESNEGLDESGEDDVDSSKQRVGVDLSTPGGEDGKRGLENSYGVIVSTKNGRRLERGVDENRLDNAEDGDNEEHERWAEATVSTLGDGVVGWMVVGKQEQGGPTKDYSHTWRPDFPKWEVAVPPARFPTQSLGGPSYSCFLTTTIPPALPNVDVSVASRPIHLSHVSSFLYLVVVAVLGISRLVLINYPSPHQDKHSAVGASSPCDRTCEDFSTRIVSRIVQEFMHRDKKGHEIVFVGGSTRIPRTVKVVSDFCRHRNHSHRQGRQDGAGHEVSREEQKARRRYSRPCCGCGFRFFQDEEPYLEMGQGRSSFLLQCQEPRAIWGPSSASALEAMKEICEVVYDQEMPEEQDTENDWRANFGSTVIAVLLNNFVEKDMYDQEHSEEDCTWYAEGLLCESAFMHEEVADDGTFLISQPSSWQGYVEVPTLDELTGLYAPWGAITLVITAGEHLMSANKNGRLEPNGRTGKQSTTISTSRSKTGRRPRPRTGCRYRAAEPEVIASAFDASAPHSNKVKRGERETNNEDDIKVPAAIAEAEDRRAKLRFCR